jgi:hypothetical protein
MDMKRLKTLQEALTVLREADSIGQKTQRLPMRDAEPIALKILHAYSPDVFDTLNSLCRARTGRNALNLLKDILEQNYIQASGGGETLRIQQETIEMSLKNGIDRELDKGISTTLDKSFLDRMAFEKSIIEVFGEKDGAIIIKSMDSKKKDPTL